MSNWVRMFIVFFGVMVASGFAILMVAAGCFKMQK